MDNYKDKGICIGNANLLNCMHGVNFMDEVDIEVLNDIYRQFSEILGMEAALTVYQNYKGMQITFPRRLFNLEYLQRKIISEYDGTNAKLLAKKYDYSEKSIRRIIKNNSLTLKC